MSDNCNSNSLQDIELMYNTQSIKVDGDCIWPVLRLKINEEIRKKSGLKSRTVNLDKSTVLRLFVTLFYGVSNLLRLGKFNFWYFSSSDRRKKIGDIYVDRIIGSLVKDCKQSVVIENPYPKGKHYPRREVETKNIFSQTIFFAGTRLFQIFVGNKIKIQGEEVIIDILRENNIQIDYVQLIRNHIAQYNFIRFLLFFVKPKAVFFIYAASSMGFIKGLKKHKIPVIEIQHGVINKFHNAYNVNKEYGYKLFPDYLLTFGHQEKEVFIKGNYFIDTNNVFPVGYDFLDRTINTPTEYLVSGKGEQFDALVIFSLQEPFEEYMFSFIIEAASLDKKVLYVIVPRDTNKLYNQVSKIENIVIERNFSVYECLKKADVHATINSTCAIEAPCFGVPNILFDYKSWSSDYYGKVLNDSGITIYCNTAEDFVNKLRTHKFYSSEKIIKESRTFFERDFYSNVHMVLKNKILKADNEE